MRKEIRTKVAFDVATQVTLAEAAIDIALSEVASLTATLIAARAEAALPAMIGHEALARVHDASVHLIAARGAGLAAHRELLIVRDQIGLRTTGLGDMAGCPPVKGMGDGDNVVRLATA